MTAHHLSNRALRRSEWVDAYPYWTPTELTSGLWAVTLPADHWPGDPPNAYLFTNANGPALLVDGGWGWAEDFPHLLDLLSSARVASFEALVTHGHPDHAGGIARLARERTLVVWADPLEAKILARYNRGLRPSFLTPGQLVGPPRFDLRVHRLPGHTIGSVAVVSPSFVLTGDVLLGRGSSWVGPPDGDLDAYLDSLAFLASLQDRAVLPGHGPAGAAVQPAAQGLTERRLSREQELLRLLDQGPKTPAELTWALYKDRGDPRLLVPGSLAERTVIGHLYRLERAGQVRRSSRSSVGLWALAPIE